MRISKTMHIFAHRGLLLEYPENSLPALIEAIKQGYDIETDLRLTRDGDFAIIHDENFMRLADDSRNVADLSISEIETIRYRNSTESFISLDTFLTRCKQTECTPRLALHLKADSQNKRAYQKLLHYWRKFNLYKNAFVFDLTTTAAHDLKQIDPQIKIAFIVSETQFEPTINLWNEVKDNPDFDIVWAAEYRRFYTKALIDEMKSTKQAVYCMSPDVHTALGHPHAYDGYLETWNNLINWKADGICTDKARELAKIIENM